MPKVSLDLSGVKQEAGNAEQPIVEGPVDTPAAPAPSAEAMQALTAGLPSPHLAMLEAYRQAPKKQMSFSHMPLPLIKAFEAQAEAQGMGKKEFLLHCMRLGGVDLPEYHEIFRQSRLGG